MKLNGRVLVAFMPAAMAAQAFTQSIFVAGTDSGVTAQVNVYNGQTGGLIRSFLPYSTFTGGVRVAAGDINGDGHPDVVTGTGPGAGHVKVFDGVTGAEIRSFFAYDAGFTGGVFVAAGDVNGDGKADIVTGTDTGNSAHVKVFDGVTNAEIRSFFAYDVGFTGGVRVAAGDWNGDGLDDLTTGAGPGANPQVKVFDGLTNSAIANFFAYSPGFAGGVFVASGDVNGDGKWDMVTGAGETGGPHVKVFNAADGSEIRSFFAYDAGFSGGVRVGSGDLDGDGHAEIVTGTGAGAAHLKVFDGLSNAETRSFLPFGAEYRGGIYVAASAVPEPATLLGLVVGAGFLLQRRRIRLN